jgi:hypothetical protein
MAIHRFRHFSTKRNHSRRTKLVLQGPNCFLNTAVAQTMSPLVEKVLNHKRKLLKVLWERRYRKMFGCEDETVYVGKLEFIRIP